jgi:ABC-type nitrate/sulfonate/bicarbonate transport system permease component
LKALVSQYALRKDLKTTIGAFSMKNTRKAGPEKRPGKIRLWAVLFWLLVWQAAAMALSQRLLLVSPLEVILRLSDLVRTASFWRSILFSFSRISGLDAKPK